MSPKKDDDKKNDKTPDPQVKKDKKDGAKKNKQGGKKK